MEDCLKCGKSFETKEGLEQHNKAKHFEVKKEKKKSNKKAIIIPIVILLLIVGGFWLFPGNNDPGKYDEFAQCISDSGAKFYGTFWCPHCKEQKKDFGQSAKYLPYIECSTPDGRGTLPVCANAGIEGYPTWDFSNTERATGRLSFDQLSQKTGCSI
tara:strand:- start:45 stop:515 length:471 start_codon:yes stop_codon:yes gene_type:complete